MRSYFQPRISSWDSKQIGCLFVQFQATGQSACPSNFPSGAVADPGEGTVTNAGNIQACDGGMAVMTTPFTTLTDPPQIIAGMCIVPDGTSAADVRIVFGTASGAFAQASGFNVLFRNTSTLDSVVRTFGSAEGNVSGQTFNIDLDNLPGTTPSQVDQIILTLEENNLSSGFSLQIDCLEAI